MKQILLLSLFSLITLSTSFGQLTFVPPVPVYGCPNTTHDVTVGIKNTSGTTIPPGFSYNVAITIYTPGGVALAPTNNQSFTTNGSGSGIANGDTQIVVIPAIPFTTAMACSVDVKISGNFTYNTSSTYTVQYPPDLTIQESPAGTVSLTTSLDAAYKTKFYLNANYTSAVNISTTGSYTPSVSGSYTAKAFEVNSSTAGECISASPSTAVAIVVTAIKEGQNVNVSVYPNPMTSSVTISTGLSNKLTYELSDMNGVLVRSADFTSATNVNVENLKSGSYVLVIKDNDAKIGYYKLVK